MIARRSQRKVHLMTFFYLGLIVLGLGCVSWAVFNIWVQSGYAAESVINGEIDPTSVPPGSNQSLYPNYPAKGAKIGSLAIPALGQLLPIFEGTSVDELKRGVGHFIQSVLPGEKDNCVLSGHRETVFARVGKLKIGDQLIVQTSAGKFTYEIVLIRIVDKEDRTVIVPTDHAVLTLTTCYPFLFIGDAPDRYILVADLVTGR